MIFKFQQGGALPPLVSYTPVVVQGPTSTAATSTKKDSESSDLTDKDLLKMLENLDGLPSDMAVLTKQLQNFYIDQKYMPNTSNIASRYLSTLFQMKTAKFNRQEYKDAYDAVNNNGGINEFAINDRGQVYCVNKNDNTDFKLLTPEELYNQKEYAALTNSDLLNIRAYNLDMANNASILKVVKNGIGMEGISKMIKDTVDKLGTSEISKEGYSAIKNKQILNGINILKEAAEKGALSGDGMSVDGLYKNEIITKSQAVQAQMAIDYLKAMLPSNAMALLKVKSNGTAKGAEALLTALTSSTMNSSVQFKTDIQENLNLDGSKKSTKEIEDKNKVNPAMAFQLDMGVETTLPIIAGSTDALRLQAYRMPVTTKEGNPLGITTLDKVSNTSALGGLFDFSHVTMGDQVLDMASAKNVVIDGSSIYKVYLPFDQTKAAKGIITPNLNYLNLLEKVRREIKESGAKTPEEINAIYEANNLPQFVTADGRVNEEFYKPFGVLNATALSDAFPTTVDLNDNRNFEEVDDDNEINNYWEIIKGEAAKGKNKEEFDKKSWYNDVFGDYQQMFKGLIYLPLNSTDPTLGAYSGGDTPSPTTVNDYRAKWQQDQRLNGYTNPGQLQL